MTYLYRDSLIGCCSDLSFRQRREPIRGPEFASHEAEGQERSAALKYWFTDLLFCVEFVDRKQNIDRGGNEGAKGLALAKDKTKNIFRPLRSHEVGEK